MSWRNVFGDLLAVGGAKTAKFDNDPVVVLVQKLVIISQCRIYIAVAIRAPYIRNILALRSPEDLRAQQAIILGESPNLVAILLAIKGTVDTRRNKNQL